MSTTFTFFTQGTSHSNRKRTKVTNAHRTVESSGFSTPVLCVSLYPIPFLLASLTPLLLSSSLAPGAASREGTYSFKFSLSLCLSFLSFSSPIPSLLPPCLWSRSLLGTPDGGTYTCSLPPSYLSPPPLLLPSSVPSLSSPPLGALAYRTGTYSLLILVTFPPFPFFHLLPSFSLA
jgi:hypothetical protein